MDIQYLECDFEVIDLDEQSEPDYDAADEAAARAEATFMAWFTDLSGRSSVQASTN
ncbi:MAG TPA: hypothetical protein VJ673_06165 [Aromatoleum sp.]|uniref:hypothetical protein n=1 Tax=Aromatoleum sp. TaxID=2307007 RepID=UPI002B48ED64|nr:hypothetical protein [Aromatoleum sp.]HJV25249.1 hypothetical protein [Aromatoleum sp.]